MPGTQPLAPFAAVIPPLQSTEPVPTYRRRTCAARPPRPEPPGAVLREQGCHSRNWQGGDRPLRRAWTGRRLVPCCRQRSCLQRMDLDSVPVPRIEETSGRDTFTRQYISRRTGQTRLVYVFAELDIAFRVPVRRPGHPPPPVGAAPAPVAPARDSALPGELPRGACLPGTVRSPAADRRKQRFTAQPGPVRRRRDPLDGGCLMLPGAAR